MTKKPEAYYVELDRAYRAQPGTASFILQRAAEKFRVSADEMRADIKARFGFEFH